MQNNYVFVGDFHSIVKFSFKLIFIFSFLPSLAHWYLLNKYSLEQKVMEFILIIFSQIPIFFVKSNLLILIATMVFMYISIKVQSSSM